jgi:hypothetical protein
VAWGDVNSDGFQDLFVGGHSGDASAIYLSDGLNFTNASEQYNVGWITGVRSAQFVDYDLDGRLDLCCLTDDDAAVLVCQQLADGRYRPIPVPLQQDRSYVTAASWQDLDHDSYPELIMSIRGAEGSTLSLYRRTNFEFIEERELQLPDPGTTIGSITWADWNADGQTDLFYGSGDDGSPCHLYRCNGDRWEDETVYAIEDSKIAMSGCVWADFDNNQRLDFFAPGTPEHTALELYSYNTPKMAFKNAAHSYGLDQSASYGRYAHAIDANTDGWMDLFVLRNEQWGCGLYINNQGHGFTDVIDELDLRNSEQGNNACAWADFDNDGDPDLALTQEGNGVRLYRNNTQPNHERIMLRLCQADYNTSLAGCKVFFQFVNCKAIASTESWLYSNGGDGAMITLVSADADKSGQEFLCTVTWPNGIISTLDARHLQMNKVNVLHMPTPTPRIEAIDWTNINRGGGPVVGNSPNPFNPATTVTFTINTAEQVRLSVFDLLGREVAMLTDAPYEAGEHQVTFDAGELPSGQYIARLSTASASVVHRMMLLK